MKDDIKSLLLLFVLLFWPELLLDWSNNLLRWEKLWDELTAIKSIFSSGYVKLEISVEIEYFNIKV